MNITTEQRKHIKKLQQKKYRDLSGQFVVEGFKGVIACLQSDARVDYVVIDEKKESHDTLPTVTQHTAARGCDVLWCTNSIGSQMTATDTWPGILAVVNKPEAVLPTYETILVLDGIADPGNLGTIIRTADWFGVKHILLSQKSVDPYNPKVVRSSMGSFFSVAIAESTNIIEEVELLKERGYTASALGMEGSDISEIAKSKKTMYIFGSESHGIQPELSALADETYTISGANGKAESLNVAIAAGITLHHLQTL